jgi:Tfp pilus assembly protein PilX
MKTANRRGTALAIALVTLLVVMLVAGTVLRSLVASHRRTRQTQDEVQAEWLAEAALERALVQARSSAGYAGETWRPGVTSESAGVAEIRIERTTDSPKSARISVQAHYPDREFSRASVSKYSAILLEAAP